MPLTYKITFTPAAGSPGTLVEYRKHGTEVWVKPMTAPNPTTKGEYELTLGAGDYTIRLSSIALNCTTRYRYYELSVIGTTCCAPGYILSPDETYCYKVEEVPATAPSASENAQKVSFAGYSICGSYIYNPGYNLNGTGTSTIINTSNPFWRNGSELCNTGNTSAGPLNRSAIWSSSQLPGQEIGFTVCLDIPASKQYYIGIGVDNIGILKVDGVTILEQSPAALDIQYGLDSGTSTFRVWHIYPITLTAGVHMIELIGKNDPFVGTNPAALGAEIYDNTAAQIIAATSYAGLNLIFSTKDRVGQPIQYGTNGIGYSCAPGYVLTCGAPFVCKQILTEPTQLC